MDFLNKYENDRLTIEDQKEALTNPYWAFLFAKENIPGSNFKALQAKACEDPFYAYCFAKDIPGADIKYCQEHACRNLEWAYHFALNVPGANIKYCQEYACKDSYYAYQFALNIPGANIEHCMNKAISSLENKFKKLIMEKACK